MKLLVLLLKQTDLIAELNDQLAEIGIHHGTIIDGKSMTKGLSAWSDDSIIIGGMLRRANSIEYNEECKMLMFVLKNAQIEAAKTVIEDVIGDISKPGTAVLFTMPIDFAEGLGE